MMCSVAVDPALSSSRSAWPTGWSGIDTPPVNGLIAYRMNRTPFVGPPGHAERV